MKPNSRLTVHSSLYRDLLKALSSLPKQVFIGYVYCFFLIFVVSVIDFLRPLLLVGMFLGLAVLILMETNHLASTTRFSYTTNKNALLVEVEMDVSRNIPEMLCQQLNGLTKEDITWMQQVGSEKRILPDEVLIHEQQPIDALYIVLSGTFEVSTMSRKSFSLPHESSKKIPLSVVDSQIIGEMSFIQEDEYLPSATVKAIKESLVWSIPKAVLREKIAHDSDFGSRFYKVISSILANRLRSSNKLHAVTEKEKLERSNKFDLFSKQKPFNSSPLTDLTPGMLLFMIDSFPS